ncbi:hypothetical protein BDV12DRAFT_146380 [Aspergillus spectabilis]
MAALAALPLTISYPSLFPASLYPDPTKKVDQILSIFPSLPVFLSPLHSPTPTSYSPSLSPLLSILLLELLLTFLSVSSSLSVFHVPRFLSFI